MLTIKWETFNWHEFYNQRKQANWFSVQMYIQSYYKIFKNWFSSLQVDVLFRQSINPISLPALSAIVILNDTVLWTGNFGKRNASDPLSGPPSEYTIYRLVLHGNTTYNSFTFKNLICLLNVYRVYLYCDDCSKYWHFTGQ